MIPRFLNKMLAAHLEADTPPVAQGYPAVNNAGELKEPEKSSAFAFARDRAKHSARGRTFAEDPPYAGR